MHLGNDAPIDFTHDGANNLPNDDPGDDSMSMPLCAYCGIKPGVTRDHVIPLCLFGSRRPAFLVTVPACQNCHGKSKSRDDEYLRDMLVMNVGASNHPVAQAISRGSMWRASANNRSVVANDLRAKGKYVSVYSQGIYLGEGPVIPLDEARVRRIFKTMLRGLHYQVWKQILPDDAEYQVVPCWPGKYSDLLASMQRIHCQGPAVLGDNVFSGYYLAAIDDDPYLAAWLVSFYGGVHYFLCSFRPNDPNVTPPQINRKPFDETMRLDI